MAKHVILFGSDYHSGHILGLMNPETVLYDTDENGNIVPYTPQLTASQKYLWDVYIKGIEEVKRISKKAKLHFVFVGDITHGNAKRNTTVVSAKPSDQRDIAFYNLLPILEINNLKSIYMVSGTTWHVFHHGDSENSLVKMIKMRHPKLNISFADHFLLNIDGVSIDVAHHGPGQSKRHWLEGNLARYYLRDIMIKELSHGSKPADMYVRGHVHRKIYETMNMDWGGEWITSSIVVVPPMQLHTEYSRKVTASSSFITNGLMALCIEKGKMSEPIFLDKTIDIRTRVTIS